MSKKLIDIYYKNNNFFLNKYKYQKYIYEDWT